MQIVAIDLFQKSEGQMKATFYVTKHYLSEYKFQYRTRDQISSMTSKNGYIRSAHSALYFRFLQFEKLTPVTKKKGR